MGTQRLRTANYPAEARGRLGLAVARARSAAGHRWRPSFAKAAGISVRSIELIEQGEPGVGQAVLEAVGRALPNWTEDTPQSILEDGPIPSTQPLDDETAWIYERGEPRDDVEEAIMSFEDASEERRWEAIRKHRRKLLDQQERQERRQGLDQKGG